MGDRIGVWDKVLGKAYARKNHTSDETGRPSRLFGNIASRAEYADDNINSKIIAFAFALAAEIERNLISQRTREALAAKKTAGVNLGRPKGCSKKVQRICSESGDIEALLASGATLSSVAKLYKVHRNTLARCRRMHYFEEK